MSLGMLNIFMISNKEKCKKLVLFQLNSHKMHILRMTNEINGFHFGPKAFFWWGPR